MSAHKVTQDSMGAIEVPKERYYGAVTERARRNFQIGTEKDRMPISIIYSLAMIKEVAAEINYKSERITNEQSKAIAHACRDVYMGKLDAEFPLPIWQTGSGTQTNMNVNEVVANRATEILKEQNCSSAEVHPNDHVNCGQSTNDVFPTAINVAVAMETAWRVIPALEALANCMDEKAKLFANVIKIGRTHMQDAVPMSVGQELSAYVFQINQSVDAMKKQLPSVCELAVGGTAVGTGLNCAPGFDKDMCAGLSHLIKLTNQDPGLVKELLPIRFTPISNKFAGLAGHDALVQLSGCFNCAATALTKIAKDFTLLSSGPSCGIGEFVLPANEPGSSIMPVNILKKLTSRIVIGFLMASASFICCAVVQSRMESGLCGRLPTIDSGGSSVVVYNLVNEPIAIRLTDPVTELPVFRGILPHGQSTTAVTHEAGKSHVALNFEVDIVSPKIGGTLSTKNSFTRSINILPGHESFFMLQYPMATSDLQPKYMQLQRFDYSCSSINVKSAQLYKTALPKHVKQSIVHLTNVKQNSTYNLTETQGTLRSIPPGTYWIQHISKNKMGNNERDEYRLYDLHIASINLIYWTVTTTQHRPLIPNIQWSIIEVHRGRMTNIAAQIPQICIMTIAEVLICISAITFAYNEAPPCVKTILQAVNQLTVFAGNLLVILISAINHRYQTSVLWWEMIIYALVATICSGITYSLAKKYEVNTKTEDSPFSLTKSTASRIHRIQSDLPHPYWPADNDLDLLPQQSLARANMTIRRCGTTVGCFSTLQEHILSTQCHVTTQMSSYYRLNQES